jgi:hypothetical protein
MKTKILPTILLGLSLIGLLALPACITQPIVTTDANGNSVTNNVSVLDTNRVDSVAKQAAIEGTSDVLASHPEWLPQFQQAEADLNLLAASPSISLSDILTIMQRLPVNELKSSTAKLSFEGATLVISLLDVPQLPATANADLQSIAKAIADGIAAGIPAAPTPPPAPGSLMATNAAPAS